MSKAQKQEIVSISSNNQEEILPSDKKEKRKGTDDAIRERISNEIVISLCGAVGSLTEEFRSSLKSSLEAAGYTTIPIKISDLLDLKPENKNEADRIESLQNKGNDLREKNGNDHLARLAIKKISSERSGIISNIKSDLDHDIKENKTKRRIAYIVDQLKHPSEVALFRLVYPQNFYLLTIIRTEKERRVHLEEKRIQSDKIDDIIRRDRKEKDKHGQQVEKTAVLADYFIRNQHDHARNINKEIDRFVKLIHGAEGMSPRRDEKAMMTAYFASLQSACLSRQVGAAITDQDGRVLATGRNDVPEFGGGLYSYESADHDFRCVHKGRKCYNDFYKHRLGEEIKELLINEKISDTIAKELVSKIFSETKAGDLIEYSRAIHAEMDAITTLARLQSSNTNGKTIYCTTYPCHNCARHIVAAGIIRVVYIEPYEKSLALKLHDDSITDSNESNKVVFIPYEGVSPSKYNSFFRIHEARKHPDGSANLIDISQSKQIDPQFLDSYHAYEDKITQSLESSDTTS